MRLIRNLIFLCVLALGVFYFVTKPTPLPETALAGLTPDPVKGELVFTAAGCASCHMAQGATGDEVLQLAGGQSFPSDFGTFRAPNISQDPVQGIGAWSAIDLANALTQGVGKKGEHLYPALPYASYAKMSLQDVVDLHAYMQTLPANATPSLPHEVSFPFNQRFLLGGWKFLFLNEDWAVNTALTPAATEGRYIAEALAHCAECHTPRNALGGLDTSKWMQGVAADAQGNGRVPAINPSALGWSEDEIVEYLPTGFTPDYDSAGGHMANVVEIFSKLPPEYAQAVAAYLLELQN